MTTRRRNATVDKSEPKSLFNWDSITKAVGAVVALFGIIFGVYQYNQNKETERKKLKNEKYIKVVEIASRFARATKKQEAEEAENQFWRMYDGELVIVEDENVKRAMMKFGGAVEYWKKNNGPSSDFSAPSQIEYEDLKGEPLTISELAYQLSLACRQSLEQ